MNCKNCNTSLPENQTKCPNCGNENISETQVQAEPEYISAAGEERKVPKGFSSKKNIIIVIAAAIVLLVGGVTTVAIGTNGFDFSGLRTTLQLADRYLSEHNYEQAIIEFEKVLEIEPMNVDAYLGLAEAYMALGDADKAIKILEEGIEKTGSDKLRDKLEEIMGNLKPVTNEPIETKPVVTTSVETTSVVTTTNVEAFIDKYNQRLQEQWEIDFANRVFELTNEYRVKEGKSEFKKMENIDAAATARAWEILVDYRGDNSRPDGRDYFTVFGDYNIQYHHCGENIAAGYPTPEEVMDAWINSPPHRENILSDKFTYLGVGMYYKDRDTYGYYWSQEFCSLFE